MLNFKKILKTFPFFASSFCAVSSYADSSNVKYDSAYIMACGTAQIDANQCLKDGTGATSGLFGGLAAKITSSEMGKTAGDKAAGQVANMACKDKIEKASAACQPKSE